jgi:lipid-A-disaccharide synthase
VRILISAGEVSGDIVGARLAHELQRIQPDCALFGLGGPRMAAAGVDLVATTSHLGSVGVSEAVAVGPALVRSWTNLRARIGYERPDVALLIGNDFFHLLVAHRLRKRGIPTLSLFPPQVWVWRSLARLTARRYDVILASFPDEETIYREAGGRVSFVGHYLADAISPVTADERGAARAALGLPTDGPVVGVLPGSRAHEVHRLGPVLLDAATSLVERDPSMRFVLPIADERFMPTLHEWVRARGLHTATRFTTDSWGAMRACDVLILASGTATLEAMLLGVPMVIAYRLSALSHAVVRACIRLHLIHDYVVGVPNIVLRRSVVPEILQKNLTPAAVADQAWMLLSDPSRQRAQKRAFEEAASRVAGGGTMARVAGAVLAGGRG